MKYLILPKGSETPYKRLLLTDWWGIDPVEIADGNFILNESCLAELTKYPVKVTIADKELSAKTELLKYPLVDEKDLVFKTYEMEVKKL